MKESPNGAAPLCLSLSLTLRNAADHERLLLFAPSIRRLFYATARMNSSSTWTWAVSDVSWTEGGENMKSWQVSTPRLMSLEDSLILSDQQVSRLLTTLRQWEGRQPVSVSLTMHTQECA